MGNYTDALVGLDLAPSEADQILTRATQMAAPAAIEVIHVCDQFPKSEQLRVNRESVPTAVSIDEQLSQLCEPFGIARYSVVAGRYISVIREEARNSADLVVVGVHKDSNWRSLFTASSKSMLHDIPCDVLAVNILQEQTFALANYQNILAAVDLSAESLDVLVQAQEIAQRNKAQLSVCHVLQYHVSESEKICAERALAQLCEEFRIEQKALFALEGFAADEIRRLSAALQCDLVVMGTHGKSGLELMTGSTADAVLKYTECDKLYVRLY